MEMGRGAGRVPGVAYVADEVAGLDPLSLHGFLGHAVEVGVEVAHPAVAEHGHREAAKAEVVDAVDEARRSGSHGGASRREDVDALVEAVPTRGAPCVRDLAERDAVY